MKTFIISLFLVLLAGVAYAGPVVEFNRDYTMVVHPCGLYEFTDPQPRSAGPRVLPVQSTQEGMENPVDIVVRASREEGIVAKHEKDDRWGSVWVRPGFHQLDYDTKGAIMIAHLAYMQRTHPEIRSVFIFDSRNNNRVGNYQPRLGLRLKKDYR